MPDEPIPGQQIPDPGQQTPAGFIEKARFDGLVRKVEELTLANRNIQSQLDAKTSELEQLRSQLVVKDAEKSAAVSERDRQIQNIITEKTTVEQELAELRALKLKVQVARKLGRPELMSILDTVPNMTDEAALEVVLKQFTEFADAAVAAREKQLLAGFTPPAGGLSNSGAQNSSALPTTSEEWEKYVNGMVPGSKEKERALEAWGKWVNQQR